MDGRGFGDQTPTGEKRVWRPNPYIRDGRGFGDQTPTGEKRVWRPNPYIRERRGFGDQTPTLGREEGLETKPLQETTIFRD